MTELPPKKDVALALLQGPSVYVHLDPRREGVAVPKHFKHQPQLVLQVGLNMPVKIPDLVVDDEGISCTLSFNRSPFWCSLPWHAVYALVGEDHRGMVWPDSVPPEIMAPATAPKLHAVEEKKPRKRAARQGERREPSRVTPDRPEPELTEGPRGPVRGGEARDTRSREPRPVPVAVPAPVPALARSNEPLIGDERADERAAAAAPRRAPVAGKAKKRELPPYLRVIK